MTASDRHAPWFERNPRKTLLALICVSALVIAGIFETLLTTGPARVQEGHLRFIRLKEFRPLNEARISPTPQQVADSDGLEDRDVWLRIDEDGFIRPSRVHADPEQIIVFLGGSTTACVWVQEELRFPYRVGRLLEERTGRRINAVNSGVSGATSLHSLNALVNKVIPLQPNIVVLMEAINDLAILYHEGSYWNKHPTRSLIVLHPGDQAAHLRLILAIKDLTFPNLYARIHSLLPRDRVTGLHEWAQPSFGRLEEDQFLDLYTRSLQSFVDLSRRWGSTPVLMTQFNRIRLGDDRDPRIVDWIERLGRGLDYEDFARFYTRLNERTRVIAAQRDVLLIDLAREVAASREYLYDPVHLNDQGSAQVARIVAEKLANLVE